MFLNFDALPADPSGVPSPDRRRETSPTNPLGVVRRIAIRLRHRHLADRELWTLRVRFDEIIDSSIWDLAPNIDELNERYVSYSDLYGDHMPNRRRNS